MVRAATTADLLLQIAASLDPRPAQALARIYGEGRRLLALRGWLRAGPELGARWSWTAAEIAAYAASPEYAAAMTELDKVAAAFRAANPGYDLFVNREVRSLDLQVQRWNENASVGRVAAALDAAVSAERSRWPDKDEEAAARRLTVFLKSWTPPVPITLAVPGLSAHGRSSAFDFQVQRGNRTIAGTNAATARQQWDAPGWTQRLRDAVRVAGDRFAGLSKRPMNPGITDICRAGKSCATPLREVGANVKGVYINPI